MNIIEADKFLSCAMDIGEMLLQNGAEVSRVEDTIRRLCLSQGVEKVAVFSITLNIQVTIVLNDLQTCTQTRRVSFIKTDTKRIDALNQLSRDICTQKMSIRNIQNRLEDIKNIKSYPLGIQILSFALISGSFTVFFGGDFNDMCVSAFIGGVLKLFELGLQKISYHTLIIAFLWSSLGGILCMFFIYIGLGHHSDLISMGNIMLFIPGITFTNALRDLLCGDSITGFIRLIESLILAIVMALGFTFIKILY